MPTFERCCQRHSNYIKKLQVNQAKEDQLEAQFPGALQNLIDNADTYEIEFLTDLAYGRSNLDNGAMIDIVLDELDFTTSNGKLRIEKYFGSPWEWDEKVQEWQEVDEDVVSAPSIATTTCPDCGGTGKYQGFTRIENCNTCGGTGKV